MDRFRALSAYAPNLLKKCQSLRIYTQLTFAAAQPRCLRHANAIPYLALLNCLVLLALRALWQRNNDGGEAREILAEWGEAKCVGALLEDGCVDIWGSAVSGAHTLRPGED